ncbi:uncharacterized protein LOC143561304 [Bidens hawaiensis]|uniref:uncharacterized protein LOC143561304 n=1 Tax=Bidens hawaiensis TaxID=980011 RepID=UPI00404AC8AD
MSTSGCWFRPTIGITSLSNKPSSFKKQRLRACFIEYPLASKIIVRNLSYTTNERCLNEQFSSFGEIAEVKLIKDQRSKISKGYAFIQYTNQDDAMNALEAMDEKYVDGRVVFVELAKPMDRRIAYPKTSGPPQELPSLGQQPAQD